MRNSMKILPILLLSSTLGACSMAGTGDYFADHHSQLQKQQLPHIYGTPAPCNYTGCAPQNSYPVAQGGFAQPGHAHQGHSHQQHVQQGFGQQGFGHQGQAQTVHTPNPQAFGQAVQGQNGFGLPAYAAPAAFAGQGLRGVRQSYTYGSLGAVLYDVDSELFGAQARLGWQSASIFGAEVEGSLGVTDDGSFEDFGTGALLPATSQIDNQVAAFALTRLPVTDKFNLLSRVGYHNTEFSAEADTPTGPIESDFSTDGLAFGVGAEYAFGPRTSLRADYTRYDFDGADSDAISLAVSRKF